MCKFLFHHLLCNGCTNLKLPFYLFCRICVSMSLNSILHCNSATLQCNRRGKEMQCLKDHQFTAQCLESILQTLTEGLFLTDEQGVIRYCNKALETMTGKELEADFGAEVLHIDERTLRTSTRMQSLFQGK